MTDEKENGQGVEWNRISREIPIFIDETFFGFDATVLISRAGKNKEHIFFVVPQV